MTVAAPEPVPVSGDPEALRSAVENVLRNAIRYSTEGSVVTVGVVRESEDAVVRIADRGPGVPEEKLEVLFEPFVRVDDARGRASGGAGLGLSIAARAVHLHGGSVSAKNRDGGGLEVELRLPPADAVEPS